MKQYTVIIKITDEEDTFKDLQDFVENNFSYLESIEELYSDDKNYRCLLETEDDFNYEVFEDTMDRNGYPVEFIQYEKI